MFDSGFTQDNPKKRQISPPSSLHDLSNLPDASHDGTQSESAEVVDAKTTLTDRFPEDDEDSHTNSGLLRDLETRAITVPQLVQEVKGIYAGLGVSSIVYHVLVLTTCSYGREEVY